MTREIVKGVKILVSYWPECQPWHHIWTLGSWAGQGSVLSTESGLASETHQVCINFPPTPPSCLLNHICNALLYLFARQGIIVISGMRASEYDRLSHSANIFRINLCASFNYLHPLLLCLTYSIWNFLHHSHWLVSVSGNNALFSFFCLGKTPPSFSFISYSFFSLYLTTFPCWKLLITIFFLHFVSSSKIHEEFLSIDPAHNAFSVIKIWLSWGRAVTL